MRQLSFEQLDQAFAELLHKSLILASEAETVCDEFDGHQSVQRLRGALDSFLEGSFEIPYSAMTIKFRHTDVDGVWDVVLGDEVIGKIENLSKTSTARFGFLFTRFEDDLVRQCDYFANLKRWIEVSIKQGDEIADQFR